MADNDFLRQTLTYYRDQRQRLHEQLRPVDLFIRQLETELGESSEEPTDIPPISFVLPALNADGSPSPKPPTNGKQLEFRGDEFFGKSQADGARAYITQVGHAVPLEEILQGLSKGGCHVGGSEPLKTLYVSLLRNTKDFCRLPNGLVGLRSMYPDLKPSAGTSIKPKQNSKGKKKTAAKKKRAASTKSAPRRAAQSTVTTSVSQAAAETPAKQPLPVKATVREILSDGQFHHKDDIVQRVQEKVGPGARSFTIIGMMKPPDFERDGDRFRLNG